MAVIKGTLGELLLARLKEQHEEAMKLFAEQPYPLFADFESGPPPSRWTIFRLRLGELRYRLGTRVGSLIAGCDLSDY